MRWIPYPVEMGTANAKPFPPAGQRGAHDYLAAGRWWDRPDYAMGNCLRGNLTIPTKRSKAAELAAMNREGK